MFDKNAMLRIHSNPLDHCISSLPVYQFTSLPVYQTSFPISEKQYMRETTDPISITEVSREK